MLLGRYVGSSLRPMIDAHVTIPSIKAGGFIQFLIDTDADCTTVTPADGRRLRVDYSKLTREDHSVGDLGFYLPRRGDIFLRLEKWSTNTTLNCASLNPIPIFKSF